MKTYIAPNITRYFWARKKKKFDIEYLNTIDKLRPDAWYWAPQPSGKWAVTVHDVTSLSLHQVTNPTLKCKNYQPL